MGLIICILVVCILSLRKDVLIDIDVIDFFYYFFVLYFE